MKPTLQAVADAVGVSRSTVSNAYSRPDQLSATLRERILEAARQLGYPGPNPTARSLRRGFVGSIGVLFTVATVVRLHRPVRGPLPRRGRRGGRAARHQHAAGAAAAGRDRRPAGGGERRCRRVLRLLRRRRGMGVGRASANAGCRSSARPPATTPAPTNGTSASTSGPPRAAPPPTWRRSGTGGWRCSPTPCCPDAPAGALQPGRGGRGAAPDDPGAARRVRRRLRRGRRRLGRADRGRRHRQQPPGGSRGRRRAVRPNPHRRPPCWPARTSSPSVCWTRWPTAGHDRPPVSVTGFDDVPEAAAAGLTTVRQPAEEKGRIAAELLLDPPADAGGRPRVAAHRTRRPGLHRTCPRGADHGTSHRLRHRASTR